jgi:serine/threonine protein kinase/tetratricopeptide (TPR) repeat protein
MPESDDDKTQPVTLIRPGSAFAHYQVLDRIGAGGMGEVLLAHDTKLDRRVALKLLPEALADDPDVRVRFLREARAAARLDHPNIVAIYEVGEFEGRPYIAMQYVAGKPLLDFCGNDALTIPQVLRIASGICEGLAKAHAAGITHRDIKPANILLDADFRPVLLDFGLANLEGDERLTRAGSTVGTVAYMSPEQARGLAVDSRSDLFSCGIVLYELIAGRSPFRREGEAATLNAVATAAPEPLARYKSDVPDELQRVVTKCLAKSPDERYQTAADLLADLRVIERSLAPSGSTPSTRTAATQPSVAVLPFTNMSADPENEFFSDGLSEELLNVLAKNPGLKVTGRTSSFAFKGKKEDLREIGQKLGVGTLLEGSVRRAGNRVRITAQLVNTGDGFHLWSETYDRVLDDVFALQDEIARAVAEALNVKLLGKAKASRPVDPESWALVLRASQATQQGSKSSLNVAIDLYRKAIELDPESGRPWAGLARCLLQQSAYGLADHEQGHRDAKEAIRRAMQLDDDLPEAYEALSWVLAAFDFRFKEAEAAIQKAYSLAPNDPRVLATYAITLSIFGRFDEALPIARRAAELDPLDPGAYLQLGRATFWAGRYAEAEMALKRGLELSPGVASGNMLLALTLLHGGKIDEALIFASREETGGYRSCGEAILFHSMGRKTESDRALAELLELGDTWSFQVAGAYAWRGEIDKAFEWLEKSYEARDTGTPLVKVHPLLRNLHADPRWPVLLKKIGLSG